MLNNETDVLCIDLFFMREWIQREDVTIKPFIRRRTESNSDPWLYHKMVNGDGESDIVYWIEYGVMTQTQTTRIREFDLRQMIPTKIQEICNAKYDLLVNGLISNIKLRYFPYEIVNLICQFCYL